jgi:uncharacterized protein (TIGR04255 family)
MGQKMSNAPIFFALAAIRFNALMALEQYLPAIQDNLRKAGYPDFQRNFLGIINVAVGSQSQSPQSQPIPPVMQPQARYTFFDETRTAGFILDQAMMLFQTTAYDIFEVFSGELFKGLKAVHEAATLNYSERVGVRCLDAVIPQSKETLGQYLVPSVMGIYDQLAPRELVHSYSEIRTKQGNTTLVSRAVILKQDEEGNPAIPPDLHPIDMTMGEKFKKIKGLYAVLDNDSWLEEREKFDLARLERRLDALHNELRRSFDLMVTPYAREVWR